MASADATTSRAKTALPEDRTGANLIFLVRAGALLGLLIAELWAIALLFRPEALGSAPPVWQAVLFALAHAFPVFVFAVGVLCLILASRWREVLAIWHGAAAGHGWRRWLVLNLGLFVAVAAATPALNRYGMAPGSDPWPWVGIWLAGGLAMASALTLALAPVALWRRALAAEWPTLAVAAGLATAIEAFATLAQRAWADLAFATFKLTAAIMSLYESAVTAEPDNFVLRVDGFAVHIAKECSGYEGIGLITGFLLIYLWVFRRSLRFPNAYFLLPIGVVAIFLLNGVRIAALVSIGAHFSPELAQGGFHSRAGWLAFLAVTVGLMTLSHRSGMFFAGHGEVSVARRSSARLATALLAPFIAAAVVGLAAAAFSSGHEWLYLAKVAAIALALWVCRDAYRAMPWRVSGVSIGLGATVGVLWIATAPADPARAAELGGWLATLSAPALVLWLAFRAVGTAVLVPIAEELAFRGYLHRKLIAQRFETVPAGQFTWLAFVVSTAAFGLVHDRWLSGALAGAVFALAMYRTGRISDPIAAHMAANAVIAGWAIAAGAWHLL